MKIRTDFVTNSSSSSYIITLFIETVNELYKIAYYTESQGDDSDGEAGTGLCPNEAHDILLKEVKEGRNKFRGENVTRIIKEFQIEARGEYFDELEPTLEEMKKEYSKGELTLDGKSLELFEEFLKGNYFPGCIASREIYNFSTKKHESIALIDQFEDLIPTTNLCADVFNSWYNYPDFYEEDEDDYYEDEEDEEDDYYEDEDEEDEDSDLITEERVMNYGILDPVKVNNKKIPNEEKIIANTVFVPKRESETLISNPINNEVQSMLDDIYGSKTVNQIIKNREHLLSHPEIIKAFMHCAKRSKKNKGVFYQELDYSKYYENRIALLTMLIGLDCHPFVSVKAFNKAKELYDKYCKDPIVKYRYNLMVPFWTYHNYKDSLFANWDKYIISQGSYMEEFIFNLENMNSNYYEGFVRKESINTFYEIITLIPTIELSYDECYEHAQCVKRIGKMMYDYKAFSDCHPDYYYAPQSKYPSKEVSLNITNDSINKKNMSKYRIAVTMDAIRQDDNGDFYILFHMDVVEKEKAQTIILDRYENTHSKYVDDIIKAKYKNSSVLDIFVNPFEIKSNNNKTPFDDLSNIITDEALYKDVGVKVGGFASDGTYSYNTFFPVNVGSKVYVDGTRDGEIGVVKEIIGPMNNRYYCSVMEVVGTNLRLKPFLDSSFKKANEFVNILMTCKKTNNNDETDAEDYISKFIPLSYFYQQQYEEENIYGYIAIDLDGYSQYVKSLLEKAQPFINWFSKNTSLTEEEVVFACFSSFFNENIATEHIGLIKRLFPRFLHIENEKMLKIINSSLDKFSKNGSFILDVKKIIDEYCSQNNDTMALKAFALLCIMIIEVSNYDIADNYQKLLIMLLENTKYDLNDDLIKTVDLDLIDRNYKMAIIDDIKSATLLDYNRSIKILKYIYFYEYANELLDTYIELRTLNSISAKHIKKYEELLKKVKFVSGDINSKVVNVKKEKDDVIKSNHISKLNENFIESNCNIEHPFTEDKNSFTLDQKSSNKSISKIANDLQDKYSQIKDELANLYKDDVESDDYQLITLSFITAIIGKENVNINSANLISRVLYLDCNETLKFMNEVVEKLNCDEIVSNMNDLLHKVENRARLKQILDFISSINKALELNKDLSFFDEIINE